MTYKTLSISLFLLACFSTIFCQSKIPDSIKSDLTLKASAKPYESTGFTVEKGATLTLNSGVKINLILKPGDKANYPVININGALKVVGGTKPTVKLEGKPVIVLSNAEVDITGLEGEVQTVRFFGNTTGTVKNSIFHGSRSGDSNYNFETTVPKTGSLSFQDCLFEGRGIEIHSKDFPNDLDRLSFTKCAFTTVINPNNKKKLKQFFMPITIFAYGNKCDTYLDIEFKAFNWENSKPILNEWFIADEGKRKTTEESIKGNKKIALKLSTKANTTFIQEAVPAEKEGDKKK
jgi:hypothetical protein